MKKTSFICAALSLIFLVDEARACGRRCRCGTAVRRVTIHYQAVSYPRAVIEPRAAVYAQPTMPGMAMVPTPPAASSQQAAAVPIPPVAAQPTYNYPPAESGQPAYYYTYDESGKPIPKQWVDFLFRGGKEAGMPRPPLPIIGRLRAD